MRARTYLAMNAYWLGLAFLWNGLHPIILPALLLRMVPETLKNTYLGGLTFAGLVLAMIIQPVAGALSDRTRCSVGRRKPWIAAGTFVALGCLAAMAAAKGFAPLLLAYLFLQLASNTAHGPAQGLIPDLVPSDRRGLASGVKNLFDMAGLVVASLVAGRLMGGAESAPAFVIIAAVLAASAAVTVLFTPERTGEETAPVVRAEPLWKVLRPAWHLHPTYARLVGGRFLVLLGIYAVQGFAQYYIRDSLQVADAPRVTGNLLATIGLTLTILVFPAGALSDRYGRLRMNALGGALAALGILLLVFARSVTALYACGGLVGIATGIFLSVNWALATDLVPAAEAGKYLGLSNLATAGAGAASRLAGPMIDGLNALRPGAFMGYPALFVVAAASALLGTLVMRRLDVATPRREAAHGSD